MVEDNRNTVEILRLNQLEERLHKTQIYPGEKVLIMQELFYAPNYGVIFDMPKNKRKLKILTMKDIKKNKKYQTNHIYLFSKEPFFIYRFEEISEGKISIPEKSLVSMETPYHVAGKVDENDPVVLAWGPGIPFALEGIRTIPTLDTKIYGPVVKEILKR